MSATINCLLAMSATKVKKQPCSTPYHVTFIANPHEKDIKKIYKNSINSMVCIWQIWYLVSFYHFISFLEGCHGFLGCHYMPLNFIDVSSYIEVAT